MLLALALAAALAAPPSALPAAPQAGPTGEAVSLPDAPPAWTSAIRSAEEAGAAFQKALQGRLASALSQGGAAGAIAVCATEAPRIAAEVSTASGVKMGRTSDRLRNPANVPPPWARTFVLLAAGEKAAEVKPLAVDLGGEVGVLLPIGVKATCLGCHGPAASTPPKVKEALAARYPRDQAVGYAEGDFRGFLWIEVKK